MKKQEIINLINKWLRENITEDTIVKAEIKCENQLSSWGGHKNTRCFDLAIICNDEEGGGKQ